MSSNVFGAFEPRVFVFDELAGMDQHLRSQVRGVTAVPSGPGIDVGGLPPDAQSVVDGLRGLDGRLDAAVMGLVTAAAEFGATSAAAKLLDSYLESVAEALRGQVLPGRSDPVGLGRWAAGRGLFAAKVARQLALRRYGYPWAEAWRMFGSGPRLHPRSVRLMERLNALTKAAGERLRHAGLVDELLRADSAGDLVAAPSIWKCLGYELKDAGGGKVKLVKETAKAIACTSLGKTLGTGLDAVVPDPVQDATGAGLNVVEDVENAAMEQVTPRFTADYTGPGTPPVINVELPLVETVAGGAEDFGNWTADRVSGAVDAVFGGD